MMMLDEESWSLHVNVLCIEKDNIKECTKHLTFSFLSCLLSCFPFDSFSLGHHHFLYSQGSLCLVCVHLYYQTASQPHRAYRLTGLFSTSGVDGGTRESILLGQGGEKEERFVSGRGDARKEEKQGSWGQVRLMDGKECINGNGGKTLQKGIKEIIIYITHHRASNVHHHLIIDHHPFSFSSPSSSLPTATSLTWITAIMSLFLGITRFMHWEGQWNNSSKHG